MDDEATRLLREIRDSVARSEARDNEWIAELRKSNEEGVQRWNDADARNRRFGRYNAIFIWMLLVALLMVMAANVFARFREQGIF